MNIDLGYILYPPRRSHEPGYPRLDVILRTKPTEHHFDPLRVHLSVATSDQVMIPMTIEHPWARPENYSLCAGLVELVDRKDKHVDIFTFGGALQIQPKEEDTVLVLTSPAPILLAKENPIDQLLVEEAEILLAERRAAFEAESDLYEKHLVAAPPLELYHAILVAIQERYHHLPSGGNELIFRFKYTLRVEIEAVEEQLSELQRRPLEVLL